MELPLVLGLDAMMLHCFPAFAPPPLPCALHPPPLPCALHAHFRMAQSWPRVYKE